MGVTRMNDPLESVCVSNVAVADLPESRSFGYELCIGPGPKLFSPSDMAGMLLQRASSRSITAWVAPPISPGALYNILADIIREEQQLLDFATNICRSSIAQLYYWIGHTTIFETRTMLWQETDLKGVFSRSIGENETYIKMVGDAGLPVNREHWAINSSAAIVPIGSFASADLESLFRRAWAHLRFQHPSLAAEVGPDEKSLIYTIPDAATLEVWVSNTFSVSDADSSSDVISTFQPSPYVKLVYIPKSGELLGHITHWRTDGLGVILLLDALLTIASQPSPLADPWGQPALGWRQHHLCKEQPRPLTRNRGTRHQAWSLGRLFRI